jgi:hypothetical protein
MPCVRLESQRKGDEMTPEMSSSPFDAAITELEARIRNMQITLETLQQLRAEGAAAPASSSLLSRTEESQVHHDTFFGMTIGEAARKYLSMVKTTKSTADIAANLEHGGLKHSSKDFPTTVRSILGQREDFLRVPNGDWGLAEWYPGMGRGKKARPEQAKGTPPKTKKVETGKPARSGKTLRQQILETIKTDAQKGWLASEIADRIGGNRKKIATMMWIMMKDKDLSKADIGYRLASAA